MPRGRPKVVPIADKRLHSIWCDMRRRCRDPRREAYKNYGGRGIKVCQEWMTYAPFGKWAWANGYRDDLTIERKDVDGNYEPGNCCWIPKGEQSKNRRDTVRLPRQPTAEQTARFVAAMEVAKWKDLGLSNGVCASTFLDRVRAGWGLERAATAPVDTRFLDNRNPRKKRE